MKFSSNRALALVVISSAFLLAAAGCKKSSSSNSGGSMSASVNSTAWAANYPVTGVYSGGVFDLGGIQVKSGDSTVFAVSFALPFTVNQTFSSDSTGLDVEYADSKNNLLYDGGAIVGHSVMTVTTCDSSSKKVAGTFSGVLYNVSNPSDSLTITAGTFSASYVTQ